MLAMSYMMSTDKLQRKCKNSAVLLIIFKSQQQKSRKQQINVDFINADWYTLINKLNKLIDDLSKFKEADQQQNKILKIIWQIKVL